MTTIETAYPEIEKLVQKFKKMPAQQRRTIVNEEIDQRVYKLYGLSEEEIKIVDGK